jgi:excisionase family DNA binding protein
MERLLTIEEVGELTQIKVCSLRKYVLHKDIPFIKIGGHLRFVKAEVVAWVMSRRVVVCEKAGADMLTCAAETDDTTGWLFAADTLSTGAATAGASTAGAATLGAA